MFTNNKCNAEDDIENLKNDNAALKRSVDSKSAAIGILRAELQDCQKEREKFKVMAETCHLSQPMPLYSFMSSPFVGKIQNSPILSGSQNTLAQLLSQAKEENKQLKIEISDFKCRLHDAQSDLKILRAENTRKNDVHQNRLSSGQPVSQLWKQERESLVEKLEEVSSQCQTYKADVRCLLEEREELIKERDQIHHKLHRLNHILNVLLKGRNESTFFKNRIIDLDAIIGENRYLQQRIKQMEEEKKLALATSSKYKSALQSCRMNTKSGKLRPSGNLVVSSKQVSELLNEHENNTIDGTQRDLKGLCIALSDALNQKTKANKSQKSANKVLLERVMELEKRLFSNCVDDSSKGSMAPMTALLMEGYCPSRSSSQLDVDLDSLNLDSNRMSPAASSMSDKSRVTEEETNAPAETASGESGFKSDPETLLKQELINNENCQKDVDICTNYDMQEDDSEEIVPLEDLDSYISNLKHQNLI